MNPCSMCVCLCSTEDWYHFACVGLTKAQADKISGYVCIRCSLEKSCKAAVEGIAAVVLRWCSIDDQAKNRETKKQKVEIY